MTTNPTPSLWLLSLQMAAGVGFLGLWVSAQLEHFNAAPPDRLAVKDLMHRNGLNPSRVALVKVADREL